MKKWVYKQYNASSPEAITLSSECVISPVTAAVALNRGLSSKSEIDTFINISYNDFYSPFLMKDMDKAVGIIQKALSENKKITIYGDYDVDGITSVTLLVKYLSSKGADVSFYIPDRHEEGYGMNEGAIRRLHSEGTELIITVDTGITACDEIRLAKELGIDVVVTDHHQCSDILPDCPVVNPCRHDCEYPFKLLCGVGVVFKLICAMEGGNHLQMLELYSDIVALGTIADVMNLEGENRIIVYYGLKKITESPNTGLSCLLEVSGCGKRTIDASMLGFGIAPRINAAGRIGNTAKAVQLLLSDSCTECNELSAYLDEENKLRQQTEQSILRSVYNIIENNTIYNDKKVLVIAGTGWHHGIIGIVASRVTERYMKPCILISCEDGIGKGSGRSVKGFNLFEAMSSCGELFEKFGGHELAAGLTILQENIEKLDDALNDYADKYMNTECLEAYIEIDTDITEEYIIPETVKNLELLEPYGNGNPKPLFSISNATVKDIRQMSEGKHIKFTLLKGNTVFDAVGFGKGELIEHYTIGDSVDVAGILQINVWNNTQKMQLLINDIRLSKTDDDISPVPSREDLAAIYRYFKKNAVGDKISQNQGVLARKITYSTGILLSVEKMMNVVEIFAEFRFLTYAVQNGSIDIYMLETSGKVDLEKSEKLKELRQKEGQI